MITRQVRGNVFVSGCRHIAFGINADGHNHQGFAGLVTNRFWPQLQEHVERELGTVESRIASGFIFHGLVCHRLGLGGFSHTPRFITVCLNKIDVPDDTEIACVLVGAGVAGRLYGADVNAIRGGIEASTKRVAVYSL